MPGGSRQESAPDASAYVRGDCTSDRDDLRRAYEALPAAERAALHDARADELEARGGASLRLGAIPFHREHGSDPRGAGVAALMHAIEHCVLFGFYDAVLDIGRRCHALLDCDTDPERCWLATAKVTTALTALGRPDEVAEHYEQACARTALCFEHGAVQQAIDHLTRALGVVGDDPLLLANRAMACERAGEPSRAIDDYAAAGAYDRASHL